MCIICFCLFRLRESTRQRSKEAQIEECNNVVCNHVSCVHASYPHMPEGSHCIFITYQSHYKRVPLLPTLILVAPMKMIRRFSVWHCPFTIAVAAGVCKPVERLIAFTGVCLLLAYSSHSYSAIITTTTRTIIRDE